MDDPNLVLDETADTASAKEAKEEKRKKEQFSKRLAKIVIFGDIMLSIITLALCALSIIQQFTGSMPYLTALIGVFNAATGYVLGKYMDKAKAENTVGGIVYESAMSDVDL